MKHLSLFFVIVTSQLLCFAQTIENPSFESSDEASFYIKKVEIIKDTTYVFCSYFAEAGNWANISKNTYLRDCKSHKTFPLLRCAGLPYSPETRRFSQNGSCAFLFCFPSIEGTELFDFIEHEDRTGFNIYGINLTKRHKTNYTDIELKRISEMILAYRSSSNTEKTKQLKDYAISLNNLVSYNVSIGNHAEAIRLGKVEVIIREKAFGLNHPSYIKSLRNLVGCYTVLGNYYEAMLLETKVVKVLKRTVGSNNSDYVESLNELASYQAQIGNYLEALQLVKEIVEIYKKKYGVHNPYYATALSNLSVFYAYLGNYSEAIIKENEAIKIIKNVLGVDNYHYAQSLNNMAGYYSNKGNFTEAIRLGKESTRIKKKIYGAEHPEYALSLRNLSLYYSELGDHVEALKVGNEALDIRKRLLGVNHPDYVRSLHDMAVFYDYLGKSSNALQLLTEVTKIREKVLGVNHPDYAFSLIDLALCYARTGHNLESLRIGEDGLEIIKRGLGTEHPSYARSLDILAECFFRGGKYAEAERLGLKAVELRKKILDHNHPDYILSLLKLTIYYYYNGDYVKSYEFAKQYIECSHMIILSHFRELSSNFQKTLWYSKYAHQYLRMLPSIVYKYGKAESFSFLYDKACLFSKGLLINTGNEMRRFIHESCDSLLIKQYKELSANIYKYNKLIELPIKNRFMNSDSLKNIIQDQEMKLAHEAKVFGNYTCNLNITWKEVQRNLDESDIAIEFLESPLIGTDSIMYLALTLRKGYDKPRMITLFEYNQLKALSEDDYYTRTAVSDLVWKPLEEELKGIRNIYFAPSGELHRIGIEYLPISKTENIGNVYTLYRLSSTRQLAVIRDETEGKNGILYGGLNYDEKSNSISIDSVSTKESVSRTAISRVNVDSLSIRSSFDYLEGTKKEADMIAADMKRHRVPYIYYNGTNGTEESFKKLDGTRPKLMHIATHGFFLTDEETKKSRLARPEMEFVIASANKASHPLEDKAMTRSGLLFSGCNRTFRHEQIPESEEDGILTAQEISMLDLRGLDLVVLSACQTGLGDVISGEGVFGLQRGFKKAGANTIIMSLSKVDDEATRILMVEFYHNLMNGKTKRQSLNEAQQYLRKVDNGRFDNPKYWASFIMLDGLN